MQSPSKYQRKTKITQQKHINIHQHLRRYYDTRKQNSKARFYCFVWWSSLETDWAYSLDL